MIVVSFINRTLRDKSFHRHLLVGLFTYIMTIAVLHLFLGILGWGTLTSLVIFQTMFFFYGFTITRRFIYGQSNESEQYAYSPQSQALRYAVFLFCFRVVDGAMSFILIDFFGVSYFIVPLMITGVLFILKFFVYRRYIFKRMGS